MESSGRSRWWEGQEEAPAFIRTPMAQTGMGTGMGMLWEGGGMGWERSGKEGDQNTDQDGNAVGKDSDWDRNVLGNALGKSRGGDRSARAPRHDTRRIPVRNWEL